MKKIVSRIMLLFVIAAMGCNKDKEIPIGTFSAEIDGSKVTFEVEAKATTLFVQGGYGIKLSGFKRNRASSATSLTINVVRPNAITTGGYQENMGGNPLVEISYFYEL